MERLILVCFLFSFASCSLFGQKSYGDGDFSVNPYVGAIPLDIGAKVGLSYTPSDADFVGLPVSIGIKGEFMVQPHLGMKVDFNWIYIGYKYTRLSENTHWNPSTGEYVRTTLTENYKRTSRKIRMMVGFNFYFNRSNRYHSYSTIEIGYKNVLRRQVRNSVVSSPKMFIQYGNFGFPITARIGLGQKWFLTERLAITTEVGLGATPFHLGMEVNF